jgi:hypothetical protein
MSRFQIINKGYIRQDDAKYLQVFQSLEDAINRVADQANVDPTGAQVATPPTVAGINVVESGGIHDVQIQDNSPAYRGLQYSAFYSQTPDFQNAHRIDLGESQNHRANLGPGKYYWAAASKYSSSDHSAMVFHGGPTPAAVGSGDYSGPPMQQAQGFAGQYRASSTPPTRQ